MFGIKIGENAENRENREKHEKWKNMKSLKSSLHFSYNDDSKTLKIRLSNFSKELHTKSLKIELEQRFVDSLKSN